MLKTDYINKLSGKSVCLRSMVDWGWFSVGSYQRLQKWYLMLLLL